MIFTGEERKAWLPPVKLLPSEWAGTYRYLPPKLSAEPGKWDNSRTPYLIEIMDSLADPDKEEIIFLKPTQVGFSESIRNMLGWITDQEPGPVLIVLPDEKSCKELVEERLRPLLEQTPQLAAHITANVHDITITSIQLDTCSIYLAWAGSPQSLASRPIRYCFLDEVDKYKGSKNEGDPISLARERTKTFQGRRKIFIGSTPTVPNGAIFQAFSACSDKRRFYVPCPHCSTYQTFSFAGIKWSEETPASEIEVLKLADRIESEQSAWYECEHCKGKISDIQKPEMLRRGRWLSDGQGINATGEISGERPASRSVAFWINSIYSPWVRFSQVAAEFLRSKGQPARLRSFKNSWLAEPFEHQISKINNSELFDRRITAPAPGIVPAWGQVLIMTTDVHKGFFWWGIRAWGHNYRSQLIAHGNATTYDELTKLLNTPIKSESGLILPIQRMLIDSGYETQQVYVYCSSDARIQPIKGSSKHTGTYKLSSQNPYGIGPWIVNTEYYKDRLAQFMLDPVRWDINSKITDEYINHMGNEHRVMWKGKSIWKPVSEGAPNHYFDVEVYQMAAADICNVVLLVEERIENQSKQNKNNTNSNNWIGNQSGSWW